jgi:chromosome segregation protein
VTPAGDVFAPGFVVGGDHGAPSLLELEAALEQSRSTVAAAAALVEQARFGLAGVRDQIAWRPSAPRPPWSGCTNPTPG